MSLRNSRAVAVALVAFATFTDIVAYSVAVPVLPDLGRRLGASPTMIGLLFASFGVTLLTVSIPMGAISDRVGRKGPLVSGLVVLSASTVLFAYADSLPWLFAARLVQGAADAITWVVGFALIADLYAPAERGRVTGIVMSASSMAFMVGPSLGGWLYEAGGMRLPFLTVALLAAICAAGCLWFRPPARRVGQEAVPVATILREPSVAACTALVIAIASTLSMIEPNLALYLQSSLHFGPARVGLVFAAAAVGNTIFHPVFGRMADRFGARRMTIVGLALTACALPLLGRAWSFESAVGLAVLQSAALAVAITPSLAYMGEAASKAGIGSFGVSYGIYNMAWAVGLLGGPALGGYLFERIGFANLTLAWAPGLVLVTWLLGRVQSTVGPTTFVEAEGIPRGFPRPRGPDASGAPR